MEISYPLIGISGNSNFPLRGSGNFRRPMTRISISDLPPEIAQQHLSELIFSPIGTKVSEGPSPVVEGEEISIDVLLSENPDLLL